MSPPSKHIVAKGDNLSKIAKDHGFQNWAVVWNCDGNASLRALRITVIIPNKRKVADDIAASAGVVRRATWGAAPPKKELEQDWDRMGPYVEKAMSRVPASLQVGIKKFFCGPESFTPDLNYILGEAPQVIGFFVGAGFNSMGIAS